jgi:hypothetical protein
MPAARYSRTQALIIRFQLNEVTPEITLEMSQHPAVAQSNKARTKNHF